MSDSEEFFLKYFTSFILHYVYSRFGDFFVQFYSIKDTYSFCMAPNSNTIDICISLEIVVRYWVFFNFLDVVLGSTKGMCIYLFPNDPQCSSRYVLCIIYLTSAYPKCYIFNTLGACRNLDLAQSEWPKAKLLAF